MPIPSSSLVPHNDPTLMFTTAGMVQFKPYFMGIDKPPASRLTSIQKCFRTTDIESVGDLSHLTFFEMLGNFSVGDYYKDDAISWAWDFLVDRLSIDKKRLWATVYKDDDEAFALWEKIGVPKNRILRYTAEQGNWWGPPGASGPCGPCSELHYDFGKPSKKIKNYDEANDHPALDSGRFLEIWNLVFMSYFQNEAGEREPLPATNIDTGAGLERLASVVQGVQSVYETDELSQILPVTINSLKLGDKLNDEESFWVRSISEHSRALAFLITDGVHPSNEGRGYILRRLLRRAVYGAYKIGTTDSFLSSVVKSAISNSSNYYPAVKEQESLILDLVNNEETRFQETLSKGIGMLDEQLLNLPNGEKLSGEVAFNLYDTHGLPLELVKEIALSKNVAVEESEYQKFMQEQQKRSRAETSDNSADHNIIIDQLNKKDKTDFMGYEVMQNNAEVLNIFSIEKSKEGSITCVVLDKTSMYPEGGGQIADQGTITLGDENIFIVQDVQSFGDSIVHLGSFQKGSFNTKDKVEVNVEKDLRIDAAANHTATHLLYAALKTVLGDHVKQAGSYVGPDRLRFDYTTTDAPSQDVLVTIQNIVNEKIRENIHSHIEEMNYDDALKTGASAFFGDKYSSVVRVVEYCESRGSSPIDDDACFSKELCGGTHLSSTGQAGFFVLLSDTSIGSGIRRIEAITRNAAEAYLNDQLSIVSYLGNKFKVPTNEIISRIDSIEAQIKQSSLKIEELESNIQKNKSDLFIQNATETNGIKIVAEYIPDISTDSMKVLIDEIKKKSAKTVVILTTIAKEKVQLLIGVSDDLVAQGVHAGSLVKQGSESLDGGGGGRPNFAQGGGSKIEKAEEVLSELVRAVVDQIK
tara:strand:+ start:13458 stop:16058 length:2601 start_codon:yes stop_codon:yes gene_type:complete